MINLSEDQAELAYISVVKASACMVSHCEWQHDRSQFLAPPMSALWYVEENSSAAMLTTKRSAGVTPEVTLRQQVTCTPLPSRTKAVHCDFETQKRYHQKSITGASVAPQKDLCPLKVFFLKKNKLSEHRCQTWQIKHTTLVSQCATCAKTLF